MSKPRIMYVSPVSYMKGGAEGVLMTMLSNPLIEPVLAAPEPGQISEFAEKLGVTVCFFYPRAMMRVHRPLRIGAMLAAAVDLIGCALRLRRLARVHGCTIIHSNGLKPHVINAVLGSVFRMRTLVHLHDIPHSKLENAIWRTIGAAVARVVVVSRACWPNPALPTKLRVVPNGFVPLLAKYQPRPLGPVLRLGFVGRFTPFKGLDLLLDWAKAMREAGINFTLHLRGRPDPETEVYWADIQARIERDELSNVIQVDGWRDKVEVYDGLDVLLLPSHIPDPLPLAATEAMGAGVIVATYPAGGLTDHITDGETGFLVPHPDSLTTNMRRLLNEPGLYDRIRLKSHGVALDHFNLARFHRALAEIYAEMAQL